MDTSTSPPRPILSAVSRANIPSAFSSIRKVESGGSVRLILAGELDLSARGHFHEEIADAQAHWGRVLLDLRALTFIDCACLATVFAAAGRALDEGAVLILLGPRDQVHRLLGLVGSPPGAAVLDDSDLHERRASAAA
jgi:anti-anti-sigma factor